MVAANTEPNKKDKKKVDLEATEESDSGKELA